MVTRRLFIALGLLSVLSTDGLAQRLSYGNGVQPDRPSSDSVRQDPGRSDNLNITQTIRRAILEDDSLSIYVQNVKIITQHGIVTLRGIVPSAAEKDCVEQKARTVVGTANVRNEIEVLGANGAR